MSQLPNSRAKWFSERLGIEAISRDLGPPNLFVTINLDPRASPDVRRLIYNLEHGKDMEREEPFLKDRVEFTRLMSKYAVHMSIYLYRKVKIMMHKFFTKICGIPETRISQKLCVLRTKLLKNTNRKPYTLYRMVQLSMTLSDLWPRFQGHNIFRHLISQKRHEIEP